MPGRLFLAEESADRGEFACRKPRQYLRHTMGKLIYAALTSLDGFVADAKGGFSWAEPQEDVHSFVNKLEAANGTLLLGRGMYSVLSVWEDLPGIESMPPYIREYQAAWKRTRKIVFSTSLKEAATPNTILRRSLDKAEIEELKVREKENIGIGGADLASQALALGLVDEVYQFAFPILVGSGKRWLRNAAPISLQRLESRDFLNGVTMLHYRVLESNN